MAVSVPTERRCIPMTKLVVRKLEAVKTSSTVACASAA